MSRARLRALTAGACLLFAAYAGCFLYFFVDDEAIPLVYAHNLLRGRGMVYTVLEGRVEGYSDFLHVIWSTVLLGATRGLGFSRLAPLLVGKAVSLAAGMLIIVVTARVLARMQMRAAAMVSALGFLCLAGPLAVWSVSSLETTVMALTVLAFALATWEERLTPAVVLGVLIALERIDGPLYIGGVLVAALVAHPRRWRHAMMVGAFTGALTLAYHGWRYAYFGSLLSAPLAAKILYRLDPAVHVVTKEPVAYFLGLLSIYGWTGASALAVAALLAIRSPIGRASVATVLLVGLYAERVDDWMFGWRFAVAMVPFVALVLAAAVNRLPARAAMAAAIAICVWSGLSARTFLHTYETAEDRPNFWRAPHAGQAAWLGRYNDILSACRRLMHAGDRIAFNQAGIVTYMLALENIDDLGICSTFVARLPTTDVYYTGVGRYSPLTNAPVIRTAHAYLLYQNVQFIVTPMDLLASANGGVPEFLLDGAFQRVPLDELRDMVIYRRTTKPIDRFARDPLAFTENVAHYSRVLSAAIDGRALAADEFGIRLPFLREQEWIHDFNGSLTIDVTFAREAEVVTTLYIGRVAGSAPATLIVSLRDAAGREVYHTERPVDDGAPVTLALPSGTRAAAVSLAVHAAGPLHLVLRDVRLEGQTEALRAYVLRNLRFPAR